MLKRIVTALGYAVVTVAPLIWTVGIDTPEKVGSIISAAIVAFWGKFSSSTTIIAPNRVMWSDVQRKQEQLAQINGDK